MSGQATARLLLADRHELTRAAMRAALEAEPDLRVDAETADGDGAVATAVEGQFDIILLSEQLDGLGALPACEKISAQATDARILFVADTPDQGMLRAAVEAGADGYLTKEMPLRTLVAAVRQVHHGQSYVPPNMLSALLRDLIQRRREADHARELYNTLTRREKEVLALLVDGCDHAATADILVISPQTARTHIQNVISKLAVHSRLEAAAMAVENGLVERLPVGGRT